MTVVIDASVTVAALVDGGPLGRWAEEILGSDSLAAPHLLPVEVASVLRRAVHHGDISVDVATLAHEELLALPVELLPYAPASDRVWELRENLTPYDAWYVAWAEVLEAQLATADLKLARAVGPRCTFLTPARSRGNR